MKDQPQLPSPLPGIVYSHFEARHVVSEEFIPEHGLCYLLAGSLQVAGAGETSTFHAGELVFYRKNFLAKFVKQPLQHTGFRAITVVFDRDTLLEFSQEYGLAHEQPYLAEGPVLRLPTQAPLEHFFTSLPPNFQTPPPHALARLKKHEALLLLLHAHPELKNVLFDFGQPGKIDLEKFMQTHFRFNVEAKKLAYLTGRSLASFKRDFNKVFHTSPSRWLHQKRLEEARYLLIEKNMRPSEVYHAVGFETLAHFSYSFKQFFGLNPSSVYAPPVAAG